MGKRISFDWVTVPPSNTEQLSSWPRLYYETKRSGQCCWKGALFKTEEQRTRTEIAEALLEVADQIESGSVQLESETENRDVAIPEHTRFEVERERLTDSETGGVRYELEYEIRWTN